MVKELSNPPKVDMPLKKEIETEYEGKQRRGKINKDKEIK